MRKFAGIAIVVVVVLQLSAILTFFFIYPRYRTKSFREAQSDTPVACDIERSFEPATMRTIRETGWIRELDRALSRAEYFRPNHPHREKEFYLRVTRESSRTDQYLVFLDTRGGEYDYFSVVKRSGKTTRYGSAFRSPDLRRLMEQSGLK